MSFIKPTDVDLNSLILPTALKTSGMPSFKYDYLANKVDHITHSIDRFYIPSSEECKTLKYPFPRPTDLAIVLSFAELDKNDRIPILLRDKGDDVYNQSFSSTAFLDNHVVLSHNLTFPIMMNWNIDEAKKIMYEDNKALDIKTSNYIHENKYEYILFGKFPQSYVGEKLNNELLHKYVKGQLKKPLYDEKGNIIEFRIPDKKTVYCVDSDGQEYLLVPEITFRKKPKLKISNGTIIKVPQHMFFKIEPIQWQILNSNELPLHLGGNSLYDKSSGKINLITKNTLLTGLSASMTHWTDENTEGSKLKHSVRNYLHNDFSITAFGQALPPISYGQVEKALSDIGENIKLCTLSVPTTKEIKQQIEKNKKNNTPTPQPKSSPLDENGQLKPEFVKDLKEIEKRVLNKKQPVQGDKKEEMNDNLKVLDSEMTIDEQIAKYIQCGASFMLHGLSGIGKSSRVQNINPNLFVGISLSDGMLPEEIKGKTLYPVGQASYWEPPHWYSRITEMCKENPDKKIVLFIDELTNVDPHVQDLVFDLIQYKSIAPNQGKLPNNCVVVAAGNDKADSSAAYSLAEPLFRKFSAHIYIPLSVEEFIKYGSKPHRDDPSKPQIHPIITAFVAAYGKKVLHSQYDREDPPKYAIDPRGWEQLSNIIYACDNKIIKSLFENKLGPNLTASFIEFAKTPLITPKDVLSGKVNKVPYDINKQLAIALSLRMVNKQQLSYVLSFIQETMHKEVLQTFITEWASNDPEKLLFINNLLQQKINTTTPPIPEEKAVINPQTTPNHPSEDEVSITTEKAVVNTSTGAIRPSQSSLKSFIESKNTSQITDKSEEEVIQSLKSTASIMIPKVATSAFSRWWQGKNENIEETTNDGNTSNSSSTTRISDATIKTR